ncbi:GAF domain-containing protein [Sphingomonas sp. SM33]|uniref:GAF domain-containing protein n=1 Tax=Sphingomonas telluris TaxID=2907998 RepID=A0ABS9VNH7_9SPHN|nr:GAF domain-containing protein [Sphingomonas telluris]MCH8616523.1 GAF domain-containing protein [Sphingomonas telluris]
MPFAAALRESLQERGREIPAEFERGDSLEDVLNRHLRTVEQMGGDDVSTCILLLSPDGKRLSVGAAPTLPASYCRPGDSFEIGLSHGSCAAAAYLGRPVYSVDIETDPIWADFGEVALQHGYRSCWSTPIRNPNGAIVGTFAILHRTVGMPTHEEIEAIEMITGHVAEAIMWSRGSEFIARPDRHQSDAPKLKLVSNNQEACDPATQLVTLVENLHSKAADLDRCANRAESDADAHALKKTAELSRMLIANIMLQIELISSRNSAR